MAWKASTGESSKSLIGKRVPSTGFSRRPACWKAGIFASDGCDRSGLLWIDRPVPVPFSIVLSTGSPTKMSLPSVKV